VAEELQRRRGTPTAEHLKLVLRIIDRQVPWSVDEANDACFIVRDANGQALAYVYFEDEPGRRAAASPETRPGGSRRTSPSCRNC
jgi:hypothetical protein